MRDFERVDYDVGGPSSVTVRVVAPDPDPQVNRAPAFPGSSTTRSIDENSASGVNVGAAVRATDADGDRLTYSLTGTDAGSFTINSSTGQIMVGAGTTLDYETKASYMVTVTATDPDGASDIIDVTIMVTDVDEPANNPPAFSDDEVTRSVPENSPPGTNVGDPVTGTDPDRDTLTYTLTGTDAGSFTINSSTGQIMVGAGTTLDYETKETYMVTVTATDSQMATDTIDVTIMVTDVDEPANNPPAFSDDEVTRSVPENSPPGTNVGARVTASDPDRDTLTYTLTGTDARSFTINSSTGQIMVGAGTTLDYETKETYMVTVTATDSQMATDTIDVTIMVTDVDEGVVGRYDANGSGTIEKNEVIKAINDYLFPTGGVEIISKADVIKLINLYLFPPSDVDEGVVGRYDANGNGQIDKSEVIKAINDYLFGEVGIISKADVIRLINLYLFG